MTDPVPAWHLDEFPTATRQDWRRLAEAALNGAAAERLDSKTYDDITIEPLAERRPDAAPILARPPATPWQVLSRIDFPEPALANSEALYELENGANALALVCAGAPGAYGFGLRSGEQIARALEGIDPDTAIELDLSPEAEAAIDADLAKGMVAPLRGRSARLGHDPLGAMAVRGDALPKWDEVGAHFARRLLALARAGCRGRLAVADGRIVHNAGGSEALELAYMTAVAVAYLRALEAAGADLEAARQMIFFRLAADADQFLTIAKFRALRRLWARIEAGCGLAAEPAFVSAETAWRMMTRRDPQVNVLRATVAVAAAAMGGADAVCVLPFTAALGLPDRFARRVARNMQLVLLHESQLFRVADPAAGSAAVEQLTDGLCRTAWHLFQEIEAAGGAAVALERGLIQEKVVAVLAKRRAALATGKEALTGVSVFPNLHEQQAAVLALATAPRQPGNRAKTGKCLPPLAPVRLAEPYEMLRDAADQMARATGSRPKVFLATLGSEAEFTPRVTFAENFFAAGGIESVRRTQNAAALAEEFKASGAALVCLCGPDAAYASGAIAAAAVLQAAGARRLYLGGRPGEREAAYRQVGIGTFIYAGCDALAVLEAAHHLASG